MKRRAESVKVDPETLPTMFTVSLPQKYVKSSKKMTMYQRKSYEALSGHQLLRTQKIYVIIVRAHTDEYIETWPESVTQWLQGPMDPFFGNVYCSSTHSWNTNT